MPALAEQGGWLNDAPDGGAAVCSLPAEPHEVLVVGVHLQALGHAPLEPGMLLRVSKACHPGRQTSPLLAISGAEGAAWHATMHFQDGGLSLPAWTLQKLT